MSSGGEITNRRRVLKAVCSLAAIIFPAQLLLLWLNTTRPPQSIWGAALLATMSLAIVTFPAVYSFARSPRRHRTRTRHTDLADDRKDLVQLLTREARADGREVQIFRKDDSRQWVSESAPAVPDAAGEAHDDGTVLDFASRVHALQESERLLTETQALAGLGSYVLDIPAGRWTSSSVLDGILGVVGILPIEASIDRSVNGAASLVHPDWRDVIRRHFTDDVMGSRGKFDLECQIVRQNDGETRWVHALGQLECDADDRPIRMLGTVQDITDRKNSDERLRLESIGLVAGGIAHDLNNVLQPIMTAVDMLKPAATGESSSLLDAIHSNAQRGAQMVRGVLMFARGLDGRRLHVQVRDLVREIESITTDTFPRNIQVRTTTSRDLWTVAGNPTQLHQVLINLCNNSRDAMPEGGQISITARNVTFEPRDPALRDAPPGRYVVIQVTDMGTGIPQAIIDKIFDPFFTTKDAGKGTGLGLSTSLAIVKSHGGFVRVSSKPGTGAQFWVFIPALPEGGDPRVHAPRAEVPRGNGELVLLVDDQAAVREMTRQALEAFGYRVLLASNGAYALAVFAKRSAEIAVVVTNLAMPVMDGPATIRALIKLNPAVRIIAVGSGNGSVSASLPDVEDRSIPILPKPYSPEDLLRALRQALRKEPSLV